MCNILNNKHGKNYFFANTIMDTNEYNNIIRTNIDKLVANLFNN